MVTVRPKDVTLYANLRVRLLTARQIAERAKNADLLKQIDAQLAHPFYSDSTVCALSERIAQEKRNRNEV